MGKAAPGSRTSAVEFAPLTGRERETQDTTPPGIVSSLDVQKGVEWLLLTIKTDRSERIYIYVLLSHLGNINAGRVE